MQEKLQTKNKMKIRENAYITEFKGDNKAEC